MSMSESNTELCEVAASGFRTSSIRITGVRIHRLEAPLEERFGWSLNWTDRRTATLVEVTTDAGLTGWGDGNWGGEQLLAQPELVIGRSPFEVESIFDDLRPPARAQQRMGPATGGGLDVALWDVIGQALGLPVCRLLGRQYRWRVQPYCTALYRKDWPDLCEGLAAEALEWKARGYRVIKMKTGYGPQTDVAAVRAVREVMGPDVALGIDSNCAYDSGTAVALGRRLEDFDLTWWEEPLLADDLDGYRRLRESVGVPIAAGETFDLDRLVADYVQPRLIDILQPEIEFVGLTGGRCLSYLCWLNHMRLAPHNWGTAVRTAAILHWMATVPPPTEAIAAPPVVFEFDCTPSPFRDAVVREKIHIEADGLIGVPDKPGLGIHVIPEAVEQYRVELTTVG
jgi:D-galactarolactone cycloisomerase